MLSTLTVTTTDDSGAGTLRQAILDAKAGDTIAFNIPGSGIHEIAPVYQLPTITVPLTIDGYTQPGSHANTLTDGDNATPLIELSSAKSEQDPSRGLLLASQGIAVRGLIFNFSQSVLGANGLGVDIEEPGGDTISGDFFGFNPADGTGVNGYMYAISASSSNNTIGGVAPADRNMIAGGRGTYGIEIEGYTQNGNTYPDMNNLVEGNLIGTDLTGTKVLGQFSDGILIYHSMGNTIGGTVSGAANVIAGGSWGIAVNGSEYTGAFPDPTSGNLIEGNFIGTNKAGIDGLGNGDGGVSFFDASNNTLGGTAAGAANTIAFSGVDIKGLGYGVQIDQSTGDAVVSNRIFNCGLLAIKLGNQEYPLHDPNDGLDADTGADNLQNFPVLTSVQSTEAGTTIVGKINTNPNTKGINIQFFSSPNAPSSGAGDGTVLLGSTSVDTGADGNASFTVTFPVTVPAGQYVSATAIDPNGNTSEFSQFFQATGKTQLSSADLSVTGSAPAGPLTLGDSFDYMLKLENLGPDTASGVTLTDTLPAGVTFVSADPAPTAQQGRILTFALGSLAGKATRTIQIQVKSALAGTLTNSVVITGDPSGAPDPDPENNNASQTTIVQPAPQPQPNPDLAVTLSAPPGPVLDGQQFVYTITVANHGPGSATGVTLQNWLPAAAQLISASASQGSWTPSPGTVSAALGKLSPGASATVTITISVSASSGSLFDLVHVNPAETDANPDDNSASLSTPVVSRPVPLPGPTPDGPHLLQIERFGYHRQPTTLVLTFDAALDPTTASNPANYRLTGPAPGSRAIPLSWARYDSTSYSVTLRPRRLLDFHNWFTYQIILRGSSKGGVADPAGRLLDGNFDGTPGGDLRVKFHGYGQVFPDPGAPAHAKSLRASMLIALSRRPGR